MKVLKNNFTDLHAWRTILTCRGCGSVLEIGSSDVTPRADSYGSHRYVVTCPLCRDENDVSKALPNQVVDTIRW